jgi:hypothetical protein
MHRLSLEFHLLSNYFIHRWYTGEKYLVSTSIYKSLSTIDYNGSLSFFIEIFVSHYQSLAIYSDTLCFQLFPCPSIQPSYSSLCAWHTMIHLCINSTSTNHDHLSILSLHFAQHIALTILMHLSLIYNLSNYSISWLSNWSSCLLIHWSGIAQLASSKVCWLYHNTLSLLWVYWWSTQFIHQICLLDLFIRLLEHILLDLFDYNLCWHTD